MITVIAGGVGAARLLRALTSVVDPAEIHAVVNVGDDLELGGLHISPDLDTVTYTLAGAIDPERGWGLVDESWRAMESLDRTEGRPGSDSATATLAPTSTGPNACRREPPFRPSPPRSCRHGACPTTSSR